MSINWQHADPAPQMLVLPPGVASLDEAHAAIELWEHYSGKTADPTQRLVVEVMMCQTAEGRWAAATTGREMPRQNGKGDEVEIVELWGLVQRGEAIMHTVHDAVLLASQAQQRMLSVLDHKDLRPRIKRKWMGTGQQMIEIRNGGVIWYRTRTAGGGRGVDGIDRVVIDEAQHATEEHLAAVAPTLLANPDPQMNVMGTAGIAGRSDWWWWLRRRALDADPGSFGYVGHTAERVEIADGRVVQHPIDATDRDLWAEVNPSLAARRTTIEFLEEQSRRLGPASFAREHLGVWDPPSDQGGGGLFDMRAWADLAVTADVVESEGRPSPVAFGVSVSQDRKWSHVGVVGMRPDGVTRHVAVGRSGKGTDWVASAVAELAERHAPTAVAVNPASPAGSLISELVEALRPSRVPVVQVSGRSEAQAVGMFLDRFHGRGGDVEGRPSLSHQGQPALDMSIEHATLRDVGQSKVFDHRVESVDIAPLQAVTLALFGLSTAKTPRSGRVVGIR